MTEPQLITTLTQAGSFGVLVAIIVWFGVRVIPGALQTHRETVRDLAAAQRETVRELIAEFKHENAERDRRHDLEMARHLATQDKLAAVVGDLKDASDEHSRLLRQCPHREPPALELGPHERRRGAEPHPGPERRRADPA